MAIFQPVDLHVFRDMIESESSQFTVHNYHAHPSFPSFQIFREICGVLCEKFHAVVFEEFDRRLCWRYEAHNFLSLGR